MLHIVIGQIEVTVAAAAQNRTAVAVVRGGSAASGCDNVVIAAVAVAVVVIVGKMAVHQGGHYVSGRKGNRYMIVFTLFSFALSIGMIATHGHPLLTDLYLIIWGGVVIGQRQTGKSAINMTQQKKKT